MLAQSFKSATDLKITDKQYEALIKVLAYLETEQVRHVDRHDFEHIREPLSLWVPWRTNDETFQKLKRTKKRIFNLGIWQDKTTCGTVACIGGHAELLYGEPVFSHGHNHENDWNSHKGLSALFNPQDITHNTVTVTQAARALRNFLETGHPKWRKVKATVKY